MAVPAFTGGAEQLWRIDQLTDGTYRVMPLAWIDPGTAAWADKAIVRPSEGPWRQLRRHPLHRTGPTYSMYGGMGSLRSAYGELGVGPAFTVQAGFFPEQHIGIVGSSGHGRKDSGKNRGPANRPPGYELTQPRTRPAG